MGRTGDLWTAAAAHAEIYVPSRRSSRVMSTRRRPEVIVSVTSYPARIESVWASLESILRQDTRADRVILVLSAEELSGAELPWRLRRMQNSGLTVMWIKENLRSYKKLLPVLTVEPEAIIVTADDDVIYHKRWLAELLDRHDEYPGHVVGHRGVEIAFDKDGLMPYRVWPRATSSTPPARVLLTGVGGILYPPLALSGVSLDKALAHRLCPTADDVWFKAMALLQGTATTVVADHARDRFVRFRLASQQAALYQTNLVRGGNDQQMRAVLDHFSLWKSLRVPDATDGP